MSETNNNEKKKSYGCLIFLIIMIVLGLIIFGIVKLVQNQQAKSVVDGNGSTQTNTDGDTHLFKRSANNNDIIVTSDLDLSNFGGKYTVSPQTDIDGLQITVNYLDKNKQILTSKVQNLGNVKEGVQVNFSISLFDLSFSVIWNIEYESIAVTGGTVSYFA